MTEFDYLINKIENEPFKDDPFPHLEIKNFLSQDHLEIIKNDKQIHFETCKNLDDLYAKLINKGWQIQSFPGCIDNWSKYKSNLNNKSIYKTNIVEGVGITFRLNNKQIYKNKIKDLIKFMNSDKFHNILRKKFDIKKDTTIISAIQKNLSCYEISPHPDIRAKSLTYLLNINNNEKAEQPNNNTKLLKFKNKYKYIPKFWEKNQNIDRCWVSWDICNIIKTLTDNNSIVIFKPADNPPSLHAVKLKYNHLEFQRTQIYGNLMYKKKNKLLLRQ